MELLEDQKAKVKDLYGKDFVDLCRSRGVVYSLLLHHLSLPEAVSLIFTPNKNICSYLENLQNEFKTTLIDVMNKKETNNKTEFVEKFLNENPDFILSNDGRLAKCNLKRGNICYCDDCVVIDDGEVKEFNTNRFVFADNYVFDMRDKIVFPYNEKQDAFSRSFGEIEKIDAMVAGNKTTIKVTPKVGDVVVVKTKNNLIEEYNNNNITKLEDCFLVKCETLKVINTPNVVEVGNSCLKYAKQLEELNMPNIKTVGDHFLTWNKNLKEVDLPNLKSVGISFLLLNKELKKLNAPNLESSKGEMLAINKDIEYINAPKFVDYGENINKKIKALAEKNTGLGL